MDPPALINSRIADDDMSSKLTFEMKIGCLSAWK
jgi:hypothetical protein